MGNIKVEYNGGTGFSVLLTIIFIILKLCKVISWSWWMVFAPLWISAIISLIFIIIGLVIIFTR